MVERNERSGLRHAVALHHDQANRIPEILQRAWQSAPTGDERPEFQAERPVHIAEVPPAAQDTGTLGGD